MWILIIFLLWPNPNLFAANPYKLGELDYFYYKAKKDVEKGSGNFDWREISLDSNGHFMSYLPPKAVLDLLDRPTPENARAYLVWQKQKVQRIIKAQEVLNQVIKEEKQ